MAIEYAITRTDLAQFQRDHVMLYINGFKASYNASIKTNDILKFVADPNYIINDPPKLTMSTGRQQPFAKVGGDWEVKAISGGAKGYKSFTAVAVEDNPKVKAYTFTADDIDLFVTKKVTGVIGASTAVGVGTVLNVDEVLTLTTATDYYFIHAQALDMGSVVQPFTINATSDVTTYTPKAEIQNIDITTEYRSFEAFKVKDTDLALFREKGVEGYINDAPMILDSIITINDLIKFVCVGRGVSFDGDGGVNINYGVSKGQFMTTQSDKLTSTYQWNKREKINYFQFYTSDKYPVVYTFDDEKYKYFTDRNSKPFANGVELTSNSYYRKGDVIEIKPNKGYEFITGQKVNISSNFAWDMEVNDKRTLATLTWERNDVIYGFEFTTVKSIIVDTDTTNNTYQITPRELRNLEALKLKEFDVNGVEIADYSNLLVGVMRYPFSIPANLKGSYGGIYLGHKKYDEVKATDIITDIITIDLGVINCVGQYKDLRDYANAEAILRLPHLSSVNLDLEYVIDQTIGVKYVVNLINGETTVIITSSKLPIDNNTLLTLNATLGTPIPTAHKDGFNYQPIDTDNLRLGGVNDISSPTIDIVRNEQVNGGSMFTIPVKDSGLLTGFKGWTKIDDIVMTVNATQQEKQDIIGLLKTGVFFNDD